MMFSIFSASQSHADSEGNIYWDFNILGVAFFRQRVPTEAALIIGTVCVTLWQDLFIKFIKSYQQFFLK